MNNQIDWEWKNEVDRIICMKDEAQRRRDAEERDARIAELDARIAKLKSENIELAEKLQKGFQAMINDGCSDEMILKYSGCTLEYLKSLKEYKR